MTLAYSGAFGTAGRLRLLALVRRSPLALLCATGAERAMLLAAHAALVRSVSTGAFASFVVAIAVATIATRVADGGLTTSAIRMLTDPNARESHVLGSVLVLRLILLGAALCLVAIGAYVTGHTGSEIVVFLGLTAAFSTAGVAQLVLSPLRARRLLAAEAGVNLAGTVVRYSLFATALFAFPRSSDAIILVRSAVALLIGSCLHLAVAYRVVLGRGRLLPLAVDWRRVRAIVVEAWPLALAVLLIMAHSRVGTLLLDGLASPASVAIYASAATLVAGLALLPDSVSLAKYPQLCSAAHSRNAAEFKDRLRGVLLLNLAIGLSLSAALFLWSAEIMRGFMGRDFAGASTMLRILSLSFGLGAIASVAGDALNALGRSFWNMVNVFVALLITTGLTVLLVPRIGATAAAFAQVLGMFLIALGHWSVILMNLRRSKIMPEAIMPFALTESLET